MLKRYLKTSNRTRLIGDLFKPGLAVVLAGSICVSGSAQEIYDGPNNGNWSDNSNWRDGSAPVSGSANLSILFNSGTSALTTTNQDIGTPFELQSLELGTSAWNFTINGGPLKFSNLGAAPTIRNLSNNRRLRINSDVEVADTLLVSGGTSSEQTYFSGAVSGAGGLTIDQTRLILDGSANNSFSGLTTVRNSSSLSLSKTNATAITGDLKVVGSSVSVFGSGGDQISDSSTVTVESETSSATLNVGESETIGSLRMQGNGSHRAQTSISETLTLNGDLVSLANQDTSGFGNSLISGGTLNLGGVRNVFVEDSAGASSDLQIVSEVTGGNINKTGLGTLFIANESSLVGRIDVNEGTVAVVGSVAEKISIAANGTAQLAGGEFAGVIEGSGKLEITSDSELSGAYVGAQAIDVLNSRTLATSVSSLNGADVNLESSTSRLELEEATDTTYSGSINGGSGQGRFQKIGVGTLTLTGSSDYGRATNVDEGTLKLGIAGALTGRAAMQIAAGANLDLDNFDLEVGSLSGDGDIHLGSADLSVDQGGNSDFDGGISGSGGLNLLSSSGTLRLTNQQAYTGETNVGGGRLRLVNANILHDSSDLRISSNGLVELSGDETVDAFTLEAGQIVGNGSLTASSFAVDSGRVDVELTGTSGLVKNGAGTAEISEAQSYTGDTTISGGTLFTSFSERLNDAGKVTVDGGNFQVGTHVAHTETVGQLEVNSGSVSGNGTLLSTSNFELREGDVSAKLGGSTGINKTGAGTVSISGENSFTGGTNIAQGRLIATGTALSGGNVFNDGTLELNNMDYGGVVSGTGSVEATGLVTLEGDNTHTGGTQVNAGSTLNVATAAPLSSGSVNLDGGQLRFENSTAQTLSNQLSGTGSISKNGTGELLIDGTNSYSGATLHNEGMLALGNNLALGTGELQIGEGAKLRADGARTIANAVSLGGTGIEFAGSDDLEFTSVDKMTLDNGETWAHSSSGLTSLVGDFEGKGGSTLSVTDGHLRIGDSNSFTGFKTDGDIQVSAGAKITMQSAGFIDLVPLTSLNGGTLGATNGVALASSENLIGNGIVDAKMAAQLGSVVSATTGDLLLGDQSSVAGFHSDGELRTNANTVTIFDANDIVLGTLTQLGDGTTGGSLLAGNAVAQDTFNHFLVEEGKNVTGRGNIEGNFKNQGHVIGDGTSMNERLVFGSDWEVSGIGEFVNTLVLGDFNAGNSPGISTGENQAFAGTVEIELGGNLAGFGSGHHDQITDDGQIDLFAGAELEVIAWEGYVPGFGEEFEILKWENGLFGDFAAIEVDSFYLNQGITFETFHTGTLQGGSGSLWIRSITAVPEPSTIVVLAAIGIGVFSRRRKDNANSRFRNSETMKG